MLLHFNVIFRTIKTYFNGIFIRLKMLLIILLVFLTSLKFKNLKDPLTMLYFNGDFMEKFKAIYFFIP